MGDVGDRFILIDTGQVEVEIEGSPVRTIGPGGSCGEIALLRGIPRTATVRAITEVTAFASERTGLHRRGARLTARVA